MCSEYTVVASLTATTTLLLANVPLSATLSSTQSRFFRFDVNTVAAVYIVVTAQSGDPDLFVGFGNVTAPNASNYIWASQRAGSDVVAIQPTDARACNVSSTGFCTYYIGVTAFGPSTSAFSIVAYTRSVDAIVLVDGQSQTGFVGIGETQPFAFAIPTGPFPAVTVTLGALDDGDVDLFVLVSANASVVPTHDNAQFVSQSLSGAETVTVPGWSAPVEACFATGQNCFLYIGVLGYTASLFTVTATLSGSSTQLMDGVAMPDSVTAGSQRFYSFTLRQPGVSVEFSITPMSGDPDLFVSTAVTQPNATSYMWRSNGFGNDVVLVSR
jgi:hypothetical protein